MATEKPKTDFADPDKDVDMETDAKQPEKAPEKESKKAPEKTKEPEKELTPEEEEIKRQEKLLREVHGIPEPDEMDEQPPTPENKEMDDDEADENAGIHPRIVMCKNLSRKASEDQVRTLFEFLGPIKELKTFPKAGVACLARVAFVQFKDGIDAGVAIHLTNTVFIDRPLQVTMWQEEKMPDEAEGFKHITPLTELTAYGKQENGEDGHNLVKNEVFVGSNPNALFAGYLEDASVLERTIHVSNLDEILVSEISLVQFLAIAGAVEKVKITGSEALVVFKQLKAIEYAFKLNGATFLGKQLVIRGANDRDKLMKKVEETDKEDTMRRVLAAQELIEDVVGVGRDDRPITKYETKGEYRVKRERSRDRDRRKRRSRSRDRSSSKKHKRRRERSRSRDRSKSHKKSKKHRHRDRD